MLVNYRAGTVTYVVKSGNNHGIPEIIRTLRMIVVILEKKFLFSLQKDFLKLNNKDVNA